MAALKLGVLLTLAAVTVTQYIGVNPQGGGYYGGLVQPGGLLQPGGFPFGRVPLGLQAGVGGVGAPLGYNSLYSQLQRTNIYAYNLGYDQNSAAGPNCINGMRMSNGLCQCFPGFKGADCNVPVADISLNQEAGYVCLQTAGSSQETAQQVAKYQSLGPLGQAQFRIKKLMQYGGQVPQNIDAAPPLAGPGIGAFCPSVPNGGAMAPVTKKSALTDYGYIMCSENQLCYNMECPACTMYNPRTGTCDNVVNPLARGLPNCNVGGGEAPLALKVQWYGAALARPKMSAEAGGPVAGGPVIPGTPGTAVGGAVIGRGPLPYGPGPVFG